MDALYQVMKSGGALDVEINNGPITALQWSVQEIKENFLDKIVEDNANPQSLRKFATDFGSELMRIAVARGKKTTANMLSFGLPPNADVATAEPVSKALPFPPVLPGGLIPIPINFFGSSLFDGLGYLMSCLGKLEAKKDFTTVGSSELQLKKENFLSPLLLLYGKWCLAITKECGTVAQAPTMVELAARLTARNELYYALGASAAGFESNKDFQKRVVQERKGMLLKWGFLTNTDIPPQRILTILESDSWELKLDNADPGTLIWSIPLTALWQKKKMLPVGKSLSSLTKEEKALLPQLKQMEEWEILLAHAGSSQPAPSLKFTGAANELYDFANKYLNPKLVNNWNSGREFGNCAETYALLMLKALDQLQKPYLNESKKFGNYGGLAVMVERIKSVNRVQPSTVPGVAVQPNPDAVYPKASSFCGPCPNCSFLLTSPALLSREDLLMFMASSTKPFEVGLDKIRKKWPISRALVSLVGKL